MPAETFEEYHEALDELGEAEVRRLKAKGVYGGKHPPWVDDWLEK